MFQKCPILRNFVKNVNFYHVFRLFLTEIKAFLSQVKKYRPNEMVGIPTNGRYTDLSGSPGFRTGMDGSGHCPLHWTGEEVPPGVYFGHKYIADYKEPPK